MYDSQTRQPVRILTGSHWPASNNSRAAGLYTTDMRLCGRQLETPRQALIGYPPERRRTATKAVGLGPAPRIGPRINRVCRSSSRSPARCTAFGGSMPYIRIRACESYQIWDRPPSPSKRELMQGTRDLGRLVWFAEEASTCGKGTLWQGDMA